MAGAIVHAFDAMTHRRQENPIFFLFARVVLSDDGACAEVHTPKLEGGSTCKTPKKQSAQHTPKHLHLQGTARNETRSSAKKQQQRVRVFVAQTAFARCQAPPPRQKTPPRYQASTRPRLPERRRRRLRRPPSPPHPPEEIFGASSATRPPRKPRTPGPRRWRRRPPPPTGTERRRPRRRRRRAERGGRRCRSR